MSIARKRERHGYSRTTEYKTWTRIKSRCYNNKEDTYPNYGGRGIVMCDGWRNSFLEFLQDVGLKPSASHSIDRIDVNGNYSCGKCNDCIYNNYTSNCRWSTIDVQSTNKRLYSNNSSGVKGVTFNIGKNKWESYINYRKKRIYIGTFKSKEEAIESRKLYENKFFI